MNEIEELNALNEKVEANRRKYEAQRIARQNKAHRHRTAAIRQRNRLIALDMTLVGILGIATGVLVYYLI